MAVVDAERPRQEEQREGTCTGRAEVAWLMDGQRSGDAISAAALGRAMARADNGAAS